MALKSANLIKVDDNTSALSANINNKIVALKIDPIPSVILYVCTTDKDVKYIFLCFAPNAEK